MSDISKMQLNILNFRYEKASGLIKNLLNWVNLS
ncbi:hypothetical protein STAB901_03070 [Streptococcus pyogenes STAB901]|nr:hypothetical protein STAB901_03070 [Streptococcus pyogenes STAB901]